MHDLLPIFSLRIKAQKMEQVIEERDQQLSDLNRVFQRNQKELAEMTVARDVRSALMPSIFPFDRLMCTGACGVRRDARKATFYGTLCT